MPAEAGTPARKWPDGGGGRPWPGDPGRATVARRDVPRRDVPRRDMAHRPWSPHRVPAAARAGSGTATGGGRQGRQSERGTNDLGWTYMAWAGAVAGALLWRGVTGVII